MENNKSNALMKIFTLSVFVNVLSWFFSVFLFADAGFIYSDVAYLIQTNSGDFAKIAFNKYVSWVYIALWIVVPLSLFSFKKITKYIFICFLFYDLFLAMFTGVQISIGENNFMGYLYTITSGVILVLLHNDILGKKFV